MRMVVFDEMRRRHEERMKSVSTEVEEAHIAAGTERITGQDEVAGGQEELRRGCAANEIAPGTKNQLDEGNKCHSGERATSAATVPGTARIAAELESKQKRAAARKEKRCSAAAREEFL